MPPPAAPGHRADADLSLAERVVLGLVATGADYGWTIVRELSTDGELGRVWHLSRPLTYRAIDTLTDKGMLRRRGTDRGAGRERVLLAATAAGRRVLRRWLDAPVTHIRDVRTELLAKLVLRRRSGLDDTAFLYEQRRALDPIIDALSVAPRGDDLVASWRAENAMAVGRFLDRAIGGATVTDGDAAGDLHLSARNQLRGIVRGVRRGEVLSSVRVVLPDGQQLTAVITSDAVAELDIVRGDDVIVIAKSTEVMVAKPR